jgi:gliding motility-associated lipoprotein GldH
MKKKILINSFIVSILFLLATSCDNSQVYDEYYTFKSGWNSKENVHFSFNQKASKKHYNLFFNLRCNNEYEFNNLFLITKLESPKGLIKVDTLEYQIANPDGSLLGAGFSDLKESKLWYKEKVTFTETGTYKLTIEQAVRKAGKNNKEKQLNGITEIGFRIESLDTK